MGHDDDKPLSNLNMTGNITWLNWIHDFLHNGTPRLRLYSFDKTSSTFEMHRRYFEGVGNYSLLFIACLMLSILLIVGSVYVLNVNLIKYNHCNVFVCKVLIFIFGFAALLFAVMALAGHTLITKAFKRLIKQHLKEGLDVVRKFSGYIFAVGDYAFGSLHKTRDGLAATGNSGNIFKDVAAKATKFIALPILDKMLVQEKYIDKLKSTTQKVEDIFQKISTKVPQYLQYCMYALIANLIVCIWMTASSLCKRPDPLVYRVCIIVLMIWWLLGSGFFPFLLMAADLCDHPAGVVASIATYFHSSIDPNLIHYYADCVEPNPIQPQLDVMYSVVSYVVGPMSYVIQTLGLHMDISKFRQLVTVRDYLLHVFEVGGCSWSSRQTRKTFEDICSNAFMGLGCITCAAIFVPAFLTIAVMACILLSGFKGWPEEEKKLYSCPSTCHIHKEGIKPAVPSHPIVRKRSEVIWPPAVPSHSIVRKRSKVIWPPQKEYDRRITCPITCRGHRDNRHNALMDLRATCAKTCRGILPRKPPPEVRAAKIARYKQMAKKKNKYAVCYIEMYNNDECVQETAICKCNAGSTKGKCDCEVCNPEHAQYSGGCNIKKCTFNLKRLKLKKNKTKQDENVGEK